MTADFQMLPSTFDATEDTFVALTERARKRVNGAVSFTVRRSTAGIVIDTLEAEGYSVKW